MRRKNIKLGNGESPSIEDAIAQFKQAFFKAQLATDTTSVVEKMRDPVTVAVIAIVNHMMQDHWFTRIGLPMVTKAINKWFPDIVEKILTGAFSIPEDEHGDHACTGSD